MALKAFSMNTMDTEPQVRKRDKRTKNVDMIELCDKTRLHMAVLRRNATSVLTLLEQGAIVNVMDSNGTSPLHWAVRNNDLEVMKLLIAYGADVNIQQGPNHPRGPPLQMAISHKNKEAVRFLLENGADPNATLFRDQSLLLFAVTARKFLSEDVHFDILQLLLDHGADCKPLLSVVTGLVRHGSERSLRLFVDRGLELSSLRKHSSQILNDAAFNADENVLKFLVKSGHFDLDAKLNDKSALYVVSCLGKARSAKCLLKYGASIDQQNVLDETALYAAIRYFRTSTLRLLLSWQADVNIKNENDQYVLEAAMMARRPDITYDVLRYLAIISEQSRFVDPANFELIKVNLNLVPLYEQFVAELRRMKLARLSDALTVFELLINARTMECHMGNEQMVLAFEKQCRKDNYPFYCDLLVEPFYKQLETQKLRVAAIRRLHPACWSLNKNALLTIFDGIFKRLKKRDLRNILNA